MDAKSEKGEKPNYVIKRDTVGWMVAIPRTAGEGAKVPGKVKFEGVSFHATVEQAAMSLRDRLIREQMPEGSAADLGTLLAALKASEERVIAAVRAATGAEQI